jgi:6-pyruvoyltetrahydropterin/6-carboxytetrahydropterin synthase
VFRVTRRYQFAASHRLHSGELSEEENRRLYGKCNNPHGHGHNYVVEVSVRGPLEGTTGRAVDIAVLDELVRREVVRPFDHRNLNREVPVFASVVPTSGSVKEQLCQPLPDGRGSESASEPRPLGSGCLRLNGLFPDRPLVPTSENLGFEICRRLKRNWKQVFPGEWPKLEKIRIGETTRNIFEVRADEIE